VPPAIVATLKYIDSCSILPFFAIFATLPE
jgi:hypothetical protein